MLLLIDYKTPPVRKRDLVYPWLSPPARTGIMQAGNEHYMGRGHHPPRGAKVEYKYITDLGHQIQLRTRGVCHFTHPDPGASSRCVLSAIITLVLLDSSY